jgi:RNA polymerase-associated protein CTR9
MHLFACTAKARLALIALQTSGRDRPAQLERAHSYLKEALTSQPSSPELRALYTYFLVETGSSRMARDFSRATLKEYNRYDIYALCASGLITYTEARESKDPSKEGAKERHRQFVRAAEFYDYALDKSPQCAFAAQGLAIAIAENTLGTGVEVTANTPALSTAAQTAKNTRDALTILTKVKESVNDGSVYVNIGHCHFLREEWERAIESVGFAFPFSLSVVA